MSETLSFLRGQVLKLEAEVKDFQKREKDFEAQVRGLTAERDTANGTLKNLEAKAGKAPAEAQARIDELTAENRGLKHKATFREKAAEAGVDPKALEVLWRESGYKADGDQVNEAAMGEAIARAKESHPFLFRSADAPDAADQAEVKPPPAPPLGAPRGGSGGKVAAIGLVVNQSQFRDPKWVYDNSKLVAEHRAAGTLTIRPDKD